MSEIDEKKSWYAAKVFYNRTLPIVEKLNAALVPSYLPSDIIPSLIFFNATETFARSFQHENYTRVWVYSNHITHQPSSIPNVEMEIFIFVTSAGQKGLIYLGEDKPEYHIGDRVRVIDGPFKGAEGHIKRIKKDRRLIVTVAGVAAIATSFIHPSFLEKI